jgi:hypothetical protein
MLPRPTIGAFDAYLAERHLRLEAIIVGGSALVLLGVTARQTRDVDILHPELSLEIMDAARGFAEHPHWPDHVRGTLGDLRRRLGHGL